MSIRSGVTAEQPGLRCCRLLLIPLYLTAGIWTLRAVAQTPSPLPEWEYSAGVPLREYFQPKPPKWQTELGLGVAMLPEYDGSSSYQVLPAPNFDIRYYNLAFLSTGEGLGINMLHGKTYRVGAAITYDLGRKLNSDFHISDSKTVSPSAELKIFGELVLFPVVLRLDLRKSIDGGYEGYVGDLSAYMPVAGSKAGHYFVFAGPAITFASSRYMTKYFGISAAQARESSLSQFTASGGIKEVSFGINATWFFRGPWFVNGVAAVSQLLGAAAQSPLTTEKTQGAFSMSVGYVFSGNSAI